MIKISGLSHSFDGDSLISGIELELADNGIYAIMGRSGCGKTTLLNILSGLLRPDSGKIESSCKRVSYMFQEPRLLPHCTALENVCLVCSNDASDKARQLLTRLGLGDALDKLPSELSGGMKQRVSLARALIYGGDLLLLDEPFNGLDDAMCHDIIGLIREYAENALVVVVLHSIEYARLLCKDECIINLSEHES